MVRFVPAFIAVALLIYGLIDCVQTRKTKTLYMPKAVWILIIVVLPIVGPGAWLLFGKNQENGEPEPRRRAPDEDPDFLWKLDRDVKREQARAEAEAERHAREEQERTDRHDHGDSDGTEDPPDEDDGPPRGHGPRPDSRDGD